MAYKDTEKQKKAQRDSYLRNKEKYQEANRARKKKSYDYVCEIKSKNPCTDCGGFFHPCQMQFDHIGTDKVKSISDCIRYYVFERVVDEIAKCELVCSNCHAMRTYLRKLEEFGGEVWQSRS